MAHRHKTNSENPLFNSEEEALRVFLDEYESLGEKYGMTGDQFWAEMESQIYELSDDQLKIRRLARSIQMCLYLIKKADLDG